MKPSKPSDPYQMTESHQRRQDGLRGAFKRMPKLKLVWGDKGDEADGASRRTGNFESTGT
ncbi:hypothetical protein F4W66_15115 [Escherichia coli]|nr:hypothetical protein F4W66_15115 [Escherichia coli]